MTCWIDQVVLDRKGHGTTATIDARLGGNGDSAGLCRAGAGREGFCDFLVRVLLVEELQDVALACCESEPGPHFAQCATKI